MKTPVVFRALLVDLDGVVRVWPGNDADLEEKHGLPTGALRSTAFEPALLRRAITGQVPDEIWRKEVLGRLQRKFPASHAHEAVAAWSAAAGDINRPVLEIVRRARDRLKVALVTNATSRLMIDLKSLGLADEFDAVVNSSVVGAAKPEAQIFHAALAKIGASSNEALFVDDSRDNVVAAKRLGICAVHFQGAQELNQFLVENRVFDDAI